MPVNKNFPMGFEPDYTPQELENMGVYAQVYGDAPSEASMKEWPERWIYGPDKMGWLEWYENYYKGRRLPEVDRKQISRWKSFKARHGSQYKNNPTSRRKAALRNWAIDADKLLEEKNAGLRMEKDDPIHKFTDRYSPVKKDPKDGTYLLSRKGDGELYTYNPSKQKKPKYIGPQKALEDWIGVGDPKKYRGINIKQEPNKRKNMEKKAHIAAKNMMNKLAALSVGDIEDEIGTFFDDKLEEKVRGKIDYQKSKRFPMRHPYLTGIPTLGIAPAISNSQAKEEIVRSLARTLPDMRNKLIEKRERDAQRMYEIMKAQAGATKVDFNNSNSANA